MMETTTQMSAADLEMLTELTEMLEGMAEVLPALTGAMLIGLIIWRVVLGLVARRVTTNRGRRGGFWWGFFMGFIGIIVAAVRPKE